MQVFNFRKENFTDILSQMTYATLKIKLEDRDNFVSSFYSVLKIHVTLKAFITQFNDINCPR